MFYDYKSSKLSTRQERSWSCTHMLYLHANSQVKLETWDPFRNSLKHLANTFKLIPFLIKVQKHFPRALVEALLFVADKILKHFLYMFDSCFVVLKSPLCLCLHKQLVTKITLKKIAFQVHGLGIFSADIWILH